MQEDQEAWPDCKVLQNRRVRLISSLLVSSSLSAHSRQAPDTTDFSRASSPALLQALKAAGLLDDGTELLQGAERLQAALNSVKEHSVHKEPAAAAAEQLPQALRCPPWSRHLI